MHLLGRSVRFSVNPFLDADEMGANSFASAPAGVGLAIFLELHVELAGRIDPETGFVVNVTEIDKAVRAEVTPIFASEIRAAHRAGEHMDLGRLIGLLRKAWGILSEAFGGAAVSRLALRLNRFRQISIGGKDGKMIQFSEKFEFAAMHKLWNDGLSEQRNFEVFGKCANPTGHGHNYTIEVTVEAAEADGIETGRFERIVDCELIEKLDHKNLNADVPFFADAIPTIENIAVFAWNCLNGKLSPMKLDCVTVWETDRTCCSYRG